jgi:uncharacterized protein YabE (DUF348 family)
VSVRSIVTRLSGALPQQLAVRPVALGLSLVALGAGHNVYEAAAHPVTITVDGVAQQVRTHGDTVADALKAADLTAGAHDLLLPAATDPISDGSEIVLRRGRELQLTVDGTTRSVWVTALSVQEALDQIGVRDGGAVLSADRSRALPLKGFSLDVRTRKNVQVLDAGKVQKLTTNALLVSEVLAEAKVTLRPADKLSAPLTAPVVDRQVLTVTRIDGKSVTEEVAIPFDTVRRADASLYKGDTRVVREGKVGVLHKTYRLTYTNGSLTERELVSSKRTADPVDQIVAYGTKDRPSYGGRSVPGTDHLNWHALARCESGGNPRAIGGGGAYRGMYQFAMSTWRGVGGSGDPIDASPAEQTYRAKLLYKRSGRGAWPHCGRYL